MKILKKARSVFHDDWCKKCYTKMEIFDRHLYMLPMSVGHYVSHSDAVYYINNLYKVNRKADIPVGMYACGITRYTCGKCGYKLTKLSIFLPVRDQEKHEEFVYFDNGELDSFLLVS